MPSLDDVYDFENRSSNEDSMFNDDSENNLMGSDQDEDETTIRDLDFSRD
jgi:hypothetical protein